MFAGARGHLGKPCLPSNQCRDLNAECSRDICLCKPDFFEKSNICSKSQISCFIHTCTWMRRDVAPSTI